MKYELCLDGRILCGKRTRFEIEQARQSLIAKGCPPPVITLNKKRVLPLARNG